MSATPLPPAVETVFTRFPVLETPRLRLRELELTDLDALHAIQSNPDVLKYIGRPPHQTMQDTEHWLARLQGFYITRESIRWGVVFPAEDRVIGTCSFHHFGANYRRVETGYDLHPAYHGQGIMTEAMQAVLAFGFKTLELHRIEAIIDIHNEASKKLLLRLGFTYEGCLRERYGSDAGLLDEHYFALLRHEWQAR